MLSNWDPRQAWPLILFCMHLALAGCGGRASDRPKTVPVTGTVTLDGQPLLDATITFVPRDEKSNPGTGATDAEGKYKLTTTANEGAIPGSYTVVVEAYRKPDGSPLQKSEEMDLEQLKSAGEAKQILPPNYSDPTQSELKAEVIIDKPNVHDFALKAK